MIEVDTKGRLKNRCFWISLLMLAVPVLVFLFFLVINTAWDHPLTFQWVVQFRNIAIYVWFVTGLIGLIAATITSHLAHWEGSPLILIPLHLLSLLMVVGLLTYGLRTPAVG
jgi:hypothetical protein